MLLSSPTIICQRHHSDLGTSSSDRDLPRGSSVAQKKIAAPSGYLWSKLYFPSEPTLHITHSHSSKPISKVLFKIQLQASSHQMLISPNITPWRLNSKRRLYIYHLGDCDCKKGLGGLCRLSQRLYNHITTLIWSQLKFQIFPFSWTPNWRRWYFWRKLCRLTRSTSRIRPIDMTELNTNSYFITITQTTTDKKYRQSFILCQSAVG